MTEIKALCMLIPIPVWVGLAIVVVLKVFLLWWNSPKQKGKRGEKLVAGRLRKGLPDEYRILNDIYLPLPDGTTTQIDHVVVSKFGVFVVETKNYSGWLYDKGAKWEQVIYHTRTTFKSPTRQNYSHICAIADNLGLPKNYIHGVVALVGDGEFKTEMPEGVIYSRDVAKYILAQHAEKILFEQVDEIVSAIISWQSSLSKEQIDNHVANLKKRHSAVREGDASRCPYCGGEMTLRKRRSDGKSFYGCRSYPKCRGIVNVD